MAEKTGITHLSENGIGNMPVAQFVEELTFGFDQEELGILKPRVLEAALTVLAEQGDSGNYCVFSNNVGHKLSIFAQKGGPESVDLLKAAAACYEFSFQRENPYDRSRTVYAGNLISTVGSYLHQKSGTSRFSEIDKSWLKSKAVVVKEALACVIHFKNYAIYEEAYQTLAGEGKTVKWTHQENLDFANAQFQIEQEGTRLSNTLSLL